VVNIERMLPRELEGERGEAPNIEKGIQECKARRKGECWKLLCESEIHS